MYCQCVCVFVCITKCLLFLCQRHWMHYVWLILNFQFGDSAYPVFDRKKPPASCQHGTRPPLVHLLLKLNSYTCWLMELHHWSADCDDVSSLWIKHMLEFPCWMLFFHNNVAWIYWVFRPCESETDKLSNVLTKNTNRCHWFSSIKQGWSFSACDCTTDKSALSPSDL